MFFSLKDYIVFSSALFALLGNQSTEQQVISGVQNYIASQEFGGRNSEFLTSTVIIILCNMHS